jgi:cyclophilin family peptidyl-prolyl cis-trans isomerase
MNTRLLTALLIIGMAVLTGCNNDNSTQSQQVILPGQVSATAAAEPQISTEIVLADYPKVALQTNRGTLVIALFDDKAPATVRNFIGYVESGHYNNTVFHRVVDNLLIQGGGYGTDYRLKAERNPIQSEASGMRNLRGTIAAARRSNDAASVGAQFFINLVDNPQFDASLPPNSGYTVFGQVVEGMQVLDAIRAEPVMTRTGVGEYSPKQAIVVQSASVVK